MVKEQLYEPFSISVATLDEYKSRKRQYSFFELVYILSGTGRKIINGLTMDYEPGSLFLVTPEDTSCFEIASTTTFFFLRFNKSFLNPNGLLAENGRRLVVILENANQRPCAIFQTAAVKPLIRQVIEGIIREGADREVCWDKMLSHLINTLLMIVGRSIIQHLPEELKDEQEEKTLDILQYIQANIYQPQLTKADNIAKTFGISLTYLSRYFKKHTGKNMQDYITGYKTKLIENRLLNSTKRVSEIVDEFGFTDESHLNKFFKKQLGVNPSDYRKSQRPQSRPPGSQRPRSRLPA